MIPESENRFSERIMRTRNIRKAWSFELNGLRLGAARINMEKMQ
jgi:hypothetical protein